MSSFTHNFHQQKKMWNYLCNSIFRQPGQKSSRYVYLSRAGWKKLHIILPRFFKEVEYTSDNFFESSEHKLEWDL